MSFLGRLRFHGVAVAAGLVACSAAPSGEPVGTTREPIVNGTDSPASQDFVVLVEHVVSCTKSVCITDECSGTLVAPNLVLTARHCVSNTADESFTCDASGAGSSGGGIGTDFDPRTIGVFVGTDRSIDMLMPAASGIQIFHDTATNLCNHDLALIGLNHLITGVPIAKLRFDAPVAGDDITDVGWGATTTANTPSTRQQRTAIPIRHVGPFSNPDGEDVPPNEFDMGESICEGDSGSPALDGTGAVLGVASRGGNNLTPNASDLGASCVGGQSLNLYSQVAAFKTVIDDAFSAMGVKPEVAAGGALGDTCSGAASCSSGLCEGSGSSAYCSQACDPTASTPCPGGYSCNTIGTQSVCQESGGCSIGRAKGASGSVWLAGAALALAGFRRRRARRG